MAPDGNGNAATVEDDEGQLLANFGMEIGVGITAPFVNPEDSENICGPGGCPVTVPEPLTLLGAGSAIGFGSLFKTKLKKKQRKDKATV